MTHKDIPPNPENRPISERVRRLLDDGARALARGNVEHARTLFERALSADSLQPEVWSWLARTAGTVDLMQATIDRGLELFPGHPLLMRTRETLLASGAIGPSDADALSMPTETGPEKSEDVLAPIQSDGDDRSELNMDDLPSGALLYVPPWDTTTPVPIWPDVSDVGDAWEQPSRVIMRSLKPAPLPQPREEPKAEESLTSDEPGRVVDPVGGELVETSQDAQEMPSEEAVQHRRAEQVVASTVTGDDSTPLPVAGTRLFAFEGQNGYESGRGPRNTVATEARVDPIHHQWRDEERKQSRARRWIRVRDVFMLAMLGFIAFGSLAFAYMNGDQSQSMQVRAALGLQTNTPTITPTTTNSPTQTTTSTVTPSPTPTQTNTPTVTTTPSSTATPTWTLTPSPTTTFTPAPTPTPDWVTSEFRPLPVEGKWIEVDLSEQMLYAHDGQEIVMETLISSGKKYTPTVKGRFRVLRKYEDQLMTGPGYYLPNVPYVMYFYGSFALHGAYWHEKWGTPTSHGCVNLRPEDAKWLYEWADPVVPADKRYLASSSSNPGTLVLIHE